MTIVRWNPVQQLASMEVDRLNRMFERVWEGSWPRAQWTPPVDIYEDEARNVVIRAELPEMKREDIQVTVDEGTLTIRGERKLRDESHRDRYHRIERAHGQFCRSFTLPNLLDTSRIAASYQDGLLTITIPPSEQAKPRKIVVEAK